jgi:hypothetical protein
MRVSERNDKWLFDKYANIKTIFNIQNTLFFKTISILRGIRPSTFFEEEVLKNKYTGITSFKLEEIKRKIITNDRENIEKSNQVQAWQKPGHGSCNVASVTSYSQNVLKLKTDKDVYGSVQCGISGSINFNLFLYLASIHKRDNINFEKDIAYLVISTCLTLLGDGGHNIREIISGHAALSVIMKDYIESNIAHIPTEYKLKWTDFSKKFYEMFKDVNIVGPLIFDQSKVDITNVDIFNIIRMHNPPTHLNDPNITIQQQLEKKLSLDNNRYLQDFKTSYLRCFSEKILQQIDDDEYITNKTKQMFEKIIESKIQGDISKYISCPYA